MTSASPFKSVGTSSKAKIFVAGGCLFRREPNRDVSGWSEPVTGQTLTDRCGDHPDEREYAWVYATPPREVIDGVDLISVCISKDAA